MTLTAFSLLVRAVTQQRAFSMWKDICSYERKSFLLFIRLIIHHAAVFPSMVRSEVAGGLYRRALCPQLFCISHSLLSVCACVPLEMYIAAVYNRDSCRSNQPSPGMQRALGYQRRSAPAASLRQAAAPQCSIFHMLLAAAFSLGLVSAHF